MLEEFEYAMSTLKTAQNSLFKRRFGTSSHETRNLLAGAFCSPWRYFLYKRYSTNHTSVSVLPPYAFGRLALIFFSDGLVVNVHVDIAKTYISLLAFL